MGLRLKDNKKTGRFPEDRHFRAYGFRARLPVSTAICLLLAASGDGSQRERLGIRNLNC
jgi:hypothetical protein